MKLWLCRCVSAVLAFVVLAWLPRAEAGEMVSLGVNGKAPEYLARLIEDADAVEFTAFGGDKIVVADPEWQRRIAREVRSAKFRNRGQSHCFCDGVPEVRFLKSGKSILIWSSHHEDLVRVGSAEVSGDFDVGKDASRWIWTIVAEKIPPDFYKPKRRERTLPEPSVKPDVQPVLPEGQKPALPKPELPKAE